MKHFANKLWNIARFILSNKSVVRPFMGHQEALAKADKSADYTAPVPITDADREILTKLETTKKSVTEHLDNFRLHEAAQDIYQFTWRELADVYVEASKKQLAEENLKENTQKILLHNLINVIKLLHPFMPFITEELWGILGQAGLLGKHDLLMVSSWPK
jgi:valyl-tRNA synthetase